MPRKPRIASPTGVYHFINRGINKRKLFHKPEDFDFYLKLVAEYLDRLELKLYHYCLMSNHTHLLLKASSLASLSQFSHFVHRRYTYYYCKTYHWSEQLFRRRFSSIPIDSDSYLMECGRYIERNPLRAKLVSAPEEYAYSSYTFYAYNKPMPWLTTNPKYDDMGQTLDERASNYSRYVMESRPYEELWDKALV